MTPKSKLEKLVEIFSNPKDSEDLYFSSIMLINAITPSGVSDVLQLRKNCLSTSNNKLFITWTSSRITQVPDYFKEVIIKAVQHLTDISSEARECAAFALKHPNKYKRHLPCITPVDKPDNERLTDLELISVLQSNRKRMTISQFKNIKWIKELIEQTADCISYDTLGEHAYSKYTGDFFPYTSASKKLKFTDTLCLIREHEYHAEFSIRMYSWLLPTADTINNKFKQKIGGGTSNTIWKKHEITDDGEPLSLLAGELRKFYQEDESAFAAAITGQESTIKTTTELLRQLMGFDDK